MKALSNLKYAMPVLAVALAPLPASASSVRIYITNSAGDSVRVSGPATNKVVQEIKNVVGAHGVNVSPDGARVYISNEETNTLDVYDRKTVKLVKKVELSDHPNNIAVTKNGDRIVVAVARGKGGLDIVDANTLTLKKTISTNGGRLHNVYGFSVVDFAERKEVTKVPLPEPPQEFDHGGYRTNEPAHGIGVAPDNKTLWATSIPNNAVYVYSLDTLKQIGRVELPSIKVAGNPMPISAVANWTTFTPDGKYLYVSNAGQRSVSVIDVPNMKFVKAIPVGEVPKRINTMVIPDDAHATTEKPGQP